MFRRMACGILLCATAALASACGDKLNPIVPDATPITETFTGTVNPASGSTHSFITLTGGKITATLTTVGTFNTTLNTCTAVLDNPAALQAFEFNATASSIGAYCVRIYDNGNVTTDNVPYTYTITVIHPQ